MTKNYNLKFEKRYSKYKYIKIEIPLKFIIGMGVFVGSSIIFYKNYNKICKHLNILKNLFYLNLGLKFTNKCINTITEINNNNKNKYIFLPTINRAKTIKNILYTVYRGVSRFIKK